MTEVFALTEVTVMNLSELVLIVQMFPFTQPTACQEHRLQYMDVRPAGSRPQQLLHYHTVAMPRVVYCLY